MPMVKIKKIKQLDESGRIKEAVKTIKAKRQDTLTLATLESRVRLLEDIVLRNTGLEEN